MEKAEVDKIKRLIADEITLLEARIMASVVTTFGEWESRQEFRHSENRARTQFLDVKVEKCISQNEGIMRAQEITQDTANKTQSLVRDLIKSNSEREGREKSEENFLEKDRAKKERRKKLILTAIGIIPFSAAVKWIINLLHLGGK